MHNVLILGGDGYLGWPTAMYLAKRGYEVTIIDNMNKKLWETRVGVKPLIPLKSMWQRVGRWNKMFPDNKIKAIKCDVAKSRQHLYNIMERLQPDTVIHYAEQPSAPFSMCAEGAAITQDNNIQGTLNLIFAALHIEKDVHIVKLGTMGEYGTPNIDIEEGWLNVNHNGREDRVLYPKKPGSWYHLSKVHDSHNLEFASRVFGLKVTDLNQGVVYGFETPETRLEPESFSTSFHYDEYFGTILNRFLVQAAVGTPLTLYGAGTQKRTFLNINDTLQCVHLAVDNPPETGEFRVFNQFTETFQLEELAIKVADVCDCEISNLPNPRVEEEDHHFQVVNTNLLDLGLEPMFLTSTIIQRMFDVVKGYVDLVDRDTILPKHKWDNRK